MSLNRRQIGIARNGCYTRLTSNILGIADVSHSKPLFADDPALTVSPLMPHSHSSPQQARIAIVEDDADQSASMMEYLTIHGYAVWAEASAAGFYRRLLVEPVDVVVLDIGLPGEDGLSIARHVIETGIGIIIVSARANLRDRLAGLDAGADAYLIKPVDLRELAAHVEALWRRIEIPGSDRAYPTPETDTAWHLNRTKRQLLTPDGKTVALTPNEFAVLACIVDNGGEVTRQSIAKVLDDNPTRFNFHRIDVLMNRLRKKVQSQTGQAMPLVTAPRQRLELTSPVVAD